VGEATPNQGVGKSQPDVPGPVAKRVRPGGRRWRRRIAWAGAGLLLAVAVGILTPFLFTTQLVRYVLRTEFRRFDPTVAKARLSPRGGLALEGLVLHDPEAGGRTLIAARRLSLKFAWGEVLRLHRKLESLDGEGVELYVRSSAKTPVTLGALSGGGATGGGEPLWVDAAGVAGTLKFETVEGVRLEGGELPMTVKLAMSREGGGVARRFEGKLGSDAGASGAGWGLVKARQDAGRVIIEEARAGNLRGGIEPGAIAGVNDSLSFGVTELSVSGSIGQAFDGTIEIKGIDLKTPEGSKRPIQLSGLGAKGVVHAATGAEAARSISISLGEAGFSSFQYGASAVDRFSTRWELAGGTLVTRDTRFSMYDADVSGHLTFDYGRGIVRECQFDLKHLDQQKLLATMAPGKVAGEGTVSGTIEVHSAPGAAGLNSLVGKVDLHTDGPGRLMIGDVPALRQAVAGTQGEDFTGVVMAQLKNYAYENGHAVLRSGPHGEPELVLNYQRKPLQPGDAGYGVEMNVGGEKVKVSQAVQIKDFVVAMPRESMGSILALATGVKSSIADVLTTQPATTAAPAATQPLAPATAPR